MTNWIGTVAAALLLTLAACASTPDAPAAPDIFVTRHLQKAEGTDPGLTPEGQQAAARLASALAGHRIGTIYVSTTRRARETAATLAARLRLTPIEYDPRDTPGLVARLLQETRPALVVGHSNTVPDIVEQLGGTRPAPIADHEYGTVWHLAGRPPVVRTFSISP